MRSFNRTYSCASAALYTFFSVDFVFSVAFIDGFVGAFINAGSASYTIITNNICHN